MKVISYLLTLILLTNSIHSLGQNHTALYNEGLALKAVNKNKEAIEKFKAAINLKPDFMEACYEMGWCQNDIKDYKGAISSLRQARKKLFTYAKVHFELGYAFEKTNSIDSAIACYNKCLAIAPGYSNAYKQLGSIAYTNDDYNVALAHYLKYEANAKSTITDYLYWYRKGYIYNNINNYDSANAALLRSLEYNNRYLNTFLELGFANNKLKRGNEAISFYNKAIALEPNSHIPYNGIAEVYRDTKNIKDSAIYWYNKTLLIKPDERKACFGLGYCYNSKGMYSTAIPFLKKAIENEKDYLAAYVELGYSYYMTNDNSTAISNFSKALQLNSRNENARYYLGLVYIDQNNRTKAQQMVDELKILKSKYAATLQAKVDKM